MKIFAFKGLLQNDSWISPAYVRCDSKGKINGIFQSKGPLSIKANEAIEEVDGYALPGFQNTHSHAFQYAMAGLAEIHAESQIADNFWSWRDKMYRIALSIDPDQMEAIATNLYSEMLRNGYTHVAEFHYLHHDKNGSQYDNLAEMGERLVAAAQTVGMKITLVPMFYQKGGFNTPPEDHQCRFITKSVDDYWKLLEASEKAVSPYDGALLGFGAHSLRAVHGNDLKEILNDGPKIFPFHIHISEQLKEIDDCIQFSGKRPVEYLFDQVEVNDRFHLVHATHLNDREVKMIAQSGAHVILCPTTEGNLGDGLFRFREYKSGGGKWSVGTDSHVSLNPLEELRLLDYGQRLVSHQRDTFVDESGDSGKYAITQALLGGRKGMGNYREEFFSVGQPFDAVVFNAKPPLIATSSTENLLSTILYTADQGMQLGTITDAVWRYHRDLIEPDHTANFQKAVKEIGLRLS